MAHSEPGSCFSKATKGNGSSRDTMRLELCQNGLSGCRRDRRQAADQCRVALAMLQKSYRSQRSRCGIKLCCLQGVLTASLEAGVDTFLFDPESASIANTWQSLARFRALSLDGEGAISNTSTDEQVQQRAALRELPADSLDLHHHSNLVGSVILEAPYAQLCLILCQVTIFGFCAR